MTSKIVITLSDDEKARLDAIAKDRDASSADIAAEAVSRYLQLEAAFRTAVEEGLRAGAEGDAMDFDIFARDIRRRMTTDASASAA